MILKLIKCLLGQRPKLIVQRLTEDAVLPGYKKDRDSGMDIHSIEEVLVPVGGRKIIRTGLAMKLPPESEIQVRSRSGLSISAGIVVTNSPGTVDESYRGEVKVIIENRGDSAFLVKHHMRIAQIVVCPVIRVDVEEGVVDQNTERGTGGFGSTGV